jgi:hypothetical protein
MSESVARKGKIARLPRKVRDALNQRLDDGQPGSQVLPWLNAMPEVQAVMDQHFNGAAINDQNLSDWRLGGFRDWQKANEESATVKQLCELSSTLVSGGRDPHEAANIIAGGRLLASLEENLQPELIREILDDKPSDMIGLIGSLVALQKERRQGVETKLDLQKFHRETGELFLKFYKDKRAAEIAESKDAHPVKLDKMIQLMFGERPGS